MHKNTLQIELPEELQEILKDFSYEINNIGCSKARVLKLSNKEKTLYLKINKTNSLFNFEKEKIILEWISERLQVPKVLYFGRKDGLDFLLLSAIEGEVSYKVETEEEKRRNIKLLAEGLKTIHALPISSCPIDNSPEKLLQLARERLKNGKIDSTEFDQRWANKNPEELFEEILKLKPSEYDPVFVHGDYCLPNIMIKNGKVSGFIDWSWGGINDRYFDFAAVMWSIRYNYGEGWVEYFIEDYGIEDFNRDKLEFFQMLNEFFQQ